ncbi:MAG: fructose-bisphosphate aldolase class I [Alphaproteobacteria bacterium]|nr:fructose-bisphosphate aldolase class I [Alphaproteobacteria bacterium]
MTASELAATAAAIVAPGKGILAADESTGTIKKRLDGIGVESTEENRRAYRELLLTAAGAAEHIGGVILFDETLRQSAADGTPFPKVLSDQGIAPGIKVDTGAKDLAGSDGEKVTEGLDGLRERLADYAKLGAKFTKWRAVITIGHTIPSRYGIEANAHALARYAALSQEAGLVPIVEPEVLMDGSHTIERCQKVTEATLQEVYNQLATHRVQLEGTLLKPNMVVAGSDCETQAGIEQVAEMTVASLRRRVPGAVPGIVFLSGGQSEQEATAHLNAMNVLGRQPWELSFSYGRALQQSALKAWGGEAGNAARAQAVYLHRARMNGLARSGDYKPELEPAA